MNSLPKPESRVAELGLSFPAPASPMGTYRPFVRVGNLVFLSGHGPLKNDGSYICGRVGDTLTFEEGVEAARQTGLALLATLAHNLGSLNRVRRVVKLLGMVNCIPEFDQHPKVINGCSNLFRDVFGEEAGVGARSAVGMNSLPSQVAVEIEGIFEVE